MSVVDWFTSRILGPAVERRVTHRLEELREAAGRPGGSDDGRFRRISQDQTRDLTPATAHRMREIAVYLYQHNPIAGRMVDLIGEWVWGEGVSFSVEHGGAKKYLDAHWKSRGAGWKRRGEQRVRELWLFGEQLWPVFTNPTSGQMSLGVLDPSCIRHVIPDPENAGQPIGLVLRGHMGVERRVRTILLEEEMISEAGERERESFRDGEAFFFTVNGLSTARRGVSVLYRLADTLDGYDQLLYSILQQEQQRNRVIWDVTLDGADDAAVKKFLEENGAPPPPYAIRVHNDKVHWNQVGQPGGSASNAAEHARLHRNQGLLGESIPEHWMGGGGDVNRAVGAEMASPFEKKMSARQRTVEGIVEDVLTAQVERGVEVGALREEERIRDITASTPDVSTRDVSRVAGAIAQVTAAMSQAVDSGFVSEDVPAKVLASLLSQMGVKVDAGDMLKMAREQKSERLIDTVTDDLAERQRERRAA